MAANQGVDQVVPGQVLNVPANRETGREVGRRDFTGAVEARRQEERERLLTDQTTYFPFAQDIVDVTRPVQPLAFEVGRFLQEGPGNLAENISDYFAQFGRGFAAASPYNALTPTERAAAIGEALAGQFGQRGVISPQSGVRTAQPQLTGQQFDVQGTQSLRNVPQLVPTGEGTGAGRMKPPWHPDVEERLLEESQQGIPYFNPVTGRRIPTISGRGQNVQRMLDAGILPTLILGSAAEQLGLTEEQLVAAGYQQDQYGNWLLGETAVPGPEQVRGTGFGAGGGGRGFGGGGGGGGGFTPGPGRSNPGAGSTGGRAVRRRSQRVRQAGDFGLTHWRGV